MDDTSLDEFLDDGEARSHADDGGVAGDGDGERVAQTVSTYTFTPEGAACAACGDEVRRRWRDDGDLVCEDCKRWE